MVIVTKRITPAAPAAGDVAIFADSADLGRLKFVDGNTGQVYIINNNELGRNIVINGGFDVAQRQVPGTLTTYSSVGGRVQSADRWWISNESASTQYQRVDTNAAPEVGLNARYYGRFKKITNATKFAFGQILEGQETMPLRGRKIRVQVKMRWTTSAVVARLGLIQLKAAGTVDTIAAGAAGFFSAWGAASTDPTLTAAANTAYIAPDANSADGGVIIGNALTCTLGATWVRYSAVFTVPADCKNLIVAIWTDVAPAANAELNISEVGLYDGPDVQDWTPSSVGETVLQCQRFYQKTFQMEVAPATAAGLLGALRQQVAIAGAVATSVVGYWQFTARMRGAPTAATFYNPSAANAFARNVPAATDATATSATDFSDRGLRWNCTGIAAWAVGADIAVHATADAEL